MSEQKRGGELTDPRAWLVWVLIALLGGGSASLAPQYLGQERMSDQEVARIAARVAEKARPDPFTGAQGITLQLEMREQVTRIEGKLDALSRTLQRHEELPAHGEVLLLIERIQAVQATQADIISRLRNVPR